jgi:hypothetical protein
MTIQDAIKAIEAAGFTAKLWEKSGIQRIYISFNFKGSSRTGGFVGSDKTELVAQACGGATEKYQSRLNEIGKMEIEWAANAANSHKVALSMLHSHHYSNKAERDRIAEMASWELTHDL